MHSTICMYYFINKNMFYYLLGYIGGKRTELYDNCKVKQTMILVYI